MHTKQAFCHWATAPTLDFYFKQRVTKNWFPDRWAHVTSPFPLCRASVVVVSWEGSRPGDMVPGRVLQRMGDVVRIGRVPCRGPGSLRDILTLTWLWFQSECLASGFCVRGTRGWLHPHRITLQLKELGLGSVHRHCTDQVMDVPSLAWDLCTDAVLCASWMSPRLWCCVTYKVFDFQ